MIVPIFPEKTNETNIKSKSLPIIFDLLIFYFIGFALFWLEAFLSMWVIQVLEGGAVVRTLRDHSIPSNGDINERAKAKSPIYLLSGLRRRSTIVMRNLTYSEPKADELAASEMAVAYSSSNWVLLVEG
eukprot:XP_008648865.1 uncharacterized protein LOC103629565 [Zea mays]